MFYSKKAKNTSRIVDKKRKKKIYKKKLIIDKILNSLCT